MSQTDTQSDTLPVTPSGAGQSSDEETTGLSPDEIFHLLQTNRRRDAMRYLHEHDEAVRMRDLAEQVAAWENDTTVRELSSTQRQRVYIPLYQTHLPKLDEAGVIDYEQSRGIVEPTPLAEELYPYIEGIDGGGTDGTSDSLAADISGPVDDRAAVARRNWDGYYTGASGLGIGLLAGSVLGLPIISTLSGVIIGAIVSVMFGLLTLARIAENALARPIE